MHLWHTAKAVEMTICQNDKMLKEQRDNKSILRKYIMKYQNGISKWQNYDAEMLKIILEKLQYAKIARI